MKIMRRNSVLVYQDFKEDVKCDYCGHDERFHPYNNGKTECIYPIDSLVDAYSGHVWHKVDQCTEFIRPAK